MTVRGIRGATTVSDDEPQSVLSATQELLLAMLQANPTLRPEDIASILFTVTPDLTSIFPARAARELGDEWAEVPLMCAQEIDADEALLHCVRVLVHWNTDLPQKEVRHVYLRDAVILRPDIAVGRP